jgi:V/A-type H+-transporting ATPase subunit I
MISLGLVLNIFNRFRQGDLVGGLLDKFGVAGAFFYWGALLLFTRSASVHAAGLWTPALWMMAALVTAWMLKAPAQMWRDRHLQPAVSTEGGMSTAILESFVGAFEGLLSYFANTVSFVRLAAYAMSHAALLLATFMIADDLKHFSFCGTFLSILAAILGNVVAIVLEGIVASVQALRLEYYEFFGKFFAGCGQPFQPFRLQSTPVATTPP